MKPIITLAIAALFAATAARADVVTKGGASGLFNSPGVRTEAAAPAAMKCANCKSEFVTMTAPAFKGSTATVSTIKRHACASCVSKWVTTGHGKAKVESAVHTCGGCNS